MARSAAPHPGRQMTDVAHKDDEPPSLPGAPPGAPMSSVTGIELVLDRRSASSGTRSSCRRSTRSCSVRHTRLDELVAEGIARARSACARSSTTRRASSRPSSSRSRSRRWRSARSASRPSRPAREPSSAASRPGPRAPSRSRVAFVFISILHVVLGEIVPKSFTLPRAERVALRVGAAVRLFFFVFGLVHLVPRLARRPRRRALSACRDTARGVAQRGGAACCCARASARACSRPRSRR